MYGWQQRIALIGWNLRAAAQTILLFPFKRLSSLNIMGQSRPAGMAHNYPELLGRVSGNQVETLNKKPANSD